MGMMSEGGGMALWVVNRVIELKRGEDAGRNETILLVSIS
jgi:hypothetical protein